MATKQRTLAAPISFEGKGLHTGLNVRMTVCPAPENSGIVFRRIDLEGSPVIPALCEFVTDTSRGTTIEKNGVKVSTIEHVMSALWTLGVDNAVIDIDAPETPIMDGSAREYAARIVETGTVEQNAECKYYEVTEKHVYTIPEKGVAIIIYPDDVFSVSVHVDYNSKVVGNQYATYYPGDDYAEKIAPCRTFVFLHELEPLMKMNLIKGGDLDNAIVVVENPVSDDQLSHLKQIFGKEDISITGGYLNNLQLRANNELARHKLLDLLGDFALLGLRIKGRVWATRPGHFANTEFMKDILRMIRRDGEQPAFKYSAKEPVMPGVLILESMAQCCGVLVLSKVPDPENYSTYFLKIDNVRFKRKVVPGDTLQLETFITEPIRRGITTAQCKAFVGGSLVCEATLTAQVVKNMK